MWQWPRSRTREERDFGTERGSRDRTAAHHITAVVVRSGNNAMQTKLKMKKKLSKMQTAKLAEEWGLQFKLTVKIV